MRRGELTFREQKKMPIPDITTLLSTTTPVALAMMNWLMPLFVIVVGVAVAGIGLLVLKNGIIGGLSRITGNKD